MNTKQADPIGYVDPGTTNASTGYKTYKTFTEGQKTKKFGSVAVGKSYATYEKYVDTADVETCPVCKQVPVYSCPCIYSDKRCEQGHTWFTKRDGAVQVGNPHTQK